MTESTPTCVSQNEKAKSEIVSQIAKIVRRAGLDYQGWRYVAKQVRKECQLRPVRVFMTFPSMTSLPSVTWFDLVFNLASALRSLITRP